MKLTSITIENYRSLEKATFEISEIAGSHTFTLIGINEAGKSSFLTAVSLLDDGKVVFPRDYFDEDQPITISFSYELTPDDRKQLKQILAQKGVTRDLLSRIDVKSVIVSAIYEPTATPVRKGTEEIAFETTVLDDYTVGNPVPIRKTEGDQPSLDLDAYFLVNFPEYFYKKSHRTTLWRSEGRYLITDPINLEAFAADPENVSIPLANCFRLAGIDDIEKEIERLASDPARINNLQQRLDDKVSAHIKRVWPKHPIRIRFQIDETSLSFLVEDNQVKYEVKTTDQRSDGFRQFVSFLLTISAESSTGELVNSFLLLDEPETHLHPQAQEDLLRELIRITSNKDNNIVVFATHSNYMIDKDSLNRCFRVSKARNRFTVVEPIEEHASSYSEVNYEVFDLVTNDYHNELYGFLEDTDKAALGKLPKEKTWDNALRNITESVSLPTYIRHSIHHPENKRNAPFSREELRKAVEVIRQLKYPKKKKTK